MPDTKKPKRPTLGIQRDAMPEPGAKTRPPVRGRHSPQRRPREDASPEQPAARSRPDPEARPGPRPAREPRREARSDTRPDTRSDAPRGRRPESSDSRPPRPDPDTRRRPRPVVTPVATQHFFVSCPRGLEGEMVRELAELGVADARPASGGAAFTGEALLAWRVCLWSRLAIRVLRRVAEGPYRSEEDLYRGASQVDWPGMFDVARTLAVTTVSSKSPLKSLNFVSLKIKDAICDRFRASIGERPSVDTHNPDVPLVLFLSEERYTLYVDLAGEPLNRRGFRVEPAAAPINENLAAGMLRLAGWQADQPLYDPMMGGGTILIEAAMMALNIAPGLNHHFAFERLADFDMVAWQRLRKDAEAAQHEPVELAIYGSDIDPLMVRAAGLNLKAAGLLDCVRLREADFLEVEAPPGPGLIVSNPPYGVRLSTDDMAALYQGMGDALKQRYPGWTASFISADPEFPKGIGLSASRRTPLYNGPLECRLFEYRLVAGSNRKPGK